MYILDDNISIVSAIIQEQLLRWFVLIHVLPIPRKKLIQYDLKFNYLIYTV